MTTRIACFFALVLGACGDADEPRPDPVPGEPPQTGGCDGEDDGFATCVGAFDPREPATFGHDEMPDIVLGPPMPPAAGGSTDVASLGCEGRITVGFAGGVPNEDGDDFIVFENAFAIDGGVFAEPAQVLVSQDGVDWYAFACDVESTEGCAGASPTAVVDANGARDPELAGGDAFDLDDVGLDHAIWIRIVDHTREHYGDDMWCGGMAGGFDLDAVARVHDP